MKKTVIPPKKILERLRSNEPGSALAAALGVREAEVVQARELLRHIGEHKAEAVGRLPDPLAQGLVEAAIQIEHAGFLQTLAEGNAKNPASFARRGLSILKARGIDVELPLTGQPVFRAESAEEEIPCLLTSIDSQGLRALWIVRPHRGGGLQAVITVFSDTAGVVRVEKGDTNRKDYRALRQELCAGASPQGHTALEIPLARARGLLARVRALTAGGLRLQEDRLLVGLAGDPADAAPLAASAPPLPDGRETARLRESAQLFEEPELKTWEPDDESCDRLELKMKEVMASTLYIDDAQRLEQARREAERLTEAFFTPQRASLYANRLFETADLLAATGRLDAAERAAATARALSAGTAPLSVPFCTRLFTKLVPVL